MCNAFSNKLLKAQCYVVKESIIGKGEQTLNEKKKTI